MQLNSLDDDVLLEVLKYPCLKKQSSLTKLSPRFSRLTPKVWSRKVSISDDDLELLMKPDKMMEIIYQMSRLKSLDKCVICRRSYSCDKIHSIATKLAANNKYLTDFDGRESRQLILDYIESRLNLEPDYNAHDFKVVFNYDSGDRQRIDSLIQRYPRVEIKLKIGPNIFNDARFSLIDHVHTLQLPIEDAISGIKDRLPTVSVFEVLESDSLFERIDLMTVLSFLPNLSAIIVHSWEEELHFRTIFSAIQSLELPKLTSVNVVILGSKWMPEDLVSFENFLQKKGNKLKHLETHFDTYPSNGGPELYRIVSNGSSQLKLKTLKLPGINYKEHHLEVNEKVINLNSFFPLLNILSNVNSIKYATKSVEDFISLRKEINSYLDVHRNKCISFDLTWTVAGRERCLSGNFVSDEDKAGNKIDPL